VTSLLWGSTLAHLIDGRLRPAIACLILAGAGSWFGVIHSGLPSGPIVWPGEAIRQLKAEGRFETSAYQTPYHWAAAYWGSAALLMALGRFGRPPASDRDDPPTAA
jgi:AGZA family xanthine/uracil permease-like MFS transporter